MQEGDRVSVRAAARRLVDQTNAFALEARQLRTDVSNAVGDMVQSRRRFAAEARDRRAFVERPQEFDHRFARAQPDRLDSLIGDCFAVELREAERVDVEPQGRGEIADDDRDVIDGAAGRRQAIASVATCRPKAPRKTSQTSPSVAPASTASRKGGIKLALPSAATRTSPKRASTAAAERSRR